jgi:hypothetical protein
VRVEGEQYRINSDSNSDSSIASSSDRAAPTMRTAVTASAASAAVKAWHSLVSAEYLVLVR